MTWGISVTCETFVVETHTIKEPIIVYVCVWYIVKSMALDHNFIFYFLKLLQINVKTLLPTL